MALTVDQRKDLRNFKEAKKIALTIEEGYLKYPSADNPFCGANLPGLGRIVVWGIDDPGTNAVPEGFYQVGSRMYAYREAKEFPMLEKRQDV